MDSSDKKTVVAVVSDYKFLNSNFNKLYDQLRGHGNYQGEILVITSKFSPCFLIKSIRKKNKVKVLRFKNIKFDKITEFELNNLETYNDPKLVDAMKESLMKASPGRFVESNIPVTGAEDFSYFSKEIPGFYFWLGVNKPGVGLDSSNFGERTDVAGNHSPYFYVDDSALDEGLRAFVHLVDDYPDKF